MVAGARGEASTPPPPAAEEAAVHAEAGEAELQGDLRLAVPSILCCVLRSPAAALPAVAATMGQVRAALQAAGGLEGLAAAPPPDGRTPLARALVEAALAALGRFPDSHELVSPTVGVLRAVVEGGPELPAATVHRLVQAAAGLVARAGTAGRQGEALGLLRSVALHCDQAAEHADDLVELLLRCAHSLRSLSQPPNDPALLRPVLDALDACLRWPAAGEPGWRLYGPVLESLTHAALHARADLQPALGSCVLSLYRRGGLDFVRHLSRALLLQLAAFLHPLALAAAVPRPAPAPPPLPPDAYSGPLCAVSFEEVLGAAARVPFAAADGPALREVFGPLGIVVPAPNAPPGQPYAFQRLPSEAARLALARLRPAPEPEPPSAPHHARSPFPSRVRASLGGPPTPPPVWEADGAAERALTAALNERVRAAAAAVHLVLAIFCVPAAAPSGGALAVSPLKAVRAEAAAGQARSGGPALASGRGELLAIVAGDVREADSALLSAVHAAALGELVVSVHEYGAASRTREQQRLEGVIAGLQGELAAHKADALAARAEKRAADRRVDALGDAVTCAICLDCFLPRCPVALACGHIYCRECAETAIRSTNGPLKGNKCPTCRLPADLADLRELRVSVGAAPD